MDRRRKLFIKLAVFLVFLCGTFFFLKHKKEMVVREGTQFLQRLLSRETEFDIKVGRITGKLSGVVRFEDVRLEDPSQPGGMKLLLRAKRIEIHYRLRDLFMKQFANSKVTVRVIEPEIVWLERDERAKRRPELSKWLKEWGMAQRQYVRLEVRDLKIVEPSGEGTLFSEIQLDYADDAFRLHLPVRHLSLGGHDVSTEFIVKGLFKPGAGELLPSISGEISTQGTIVNWSPLPWEALFTYVLSPARFEIESQELLGGFHVAGSVDFLTNDDLQFSLETEQYPLEDLTPFLRHTGKKPEGRLDLDARVKGSPSAPNLEVYATITGGRSGPNHYRSLNLYVEGVYPTLRLSDSRVLFEDGKMMRFADQNVEFADLFDESLYSKWISGQDQDTLILGKWEFSRPGERDEKQEFSMQRSFGKRASLNVRKANAFDEAKLDSPEKDDMQVGFEYRLLSKDTLKVEARSEDDRYVGVEHKMSF